MMKYTYYFDGVRYFILLQDEDMYLASICYGDKEFKIFTDNSKKKVLSKSNNLDGVWSISHNDKFTFLLKNVETLTLYKNIWDELKHKLIISNQ